MKRFEPMPSADKNQLAALDERLRQIGNGYRQPSQLTIATKTTKSGLASFKKSPPRQSFLSGWYSLVEHAINAIRHRPSAEVEKPNYARIIAVVPTYEKEADIDKTIISLVRQTRPIDCILIIVNGPGDSNVAYKKALPYAELIPNVTLIRPDCLSGRENVAKTSNPKANTMNWAYHQYAGQFDFWLGVDADVEADSDMVFHLEDDLLSRGRSASVSARYNFHVPEDMTGKSRGLVYGQRHEFTYIEMKHQLEGDVTDIAGGQATLFRVEALNDVCPYNYGNVPWDTRSKVEDAKLTSLLHERDWSTATSRNARAWTGLMTNEKSWHEQRRKWQDGHLADMTRSFHPVLDFKSWKRQFAMGWNLLIRMLFFTLLGTSLVLDSYTWMTVWLIPIGLSVLQSLLVAIKIPDRSLGEILRSIMFLPGEIYYLRSLSVWLDSVIMIILNIKRDGWGNQERAESGRKQLSFSVWIIIALAILVPFTGFMILHRFLPGSVFSTILQWSWYSLTAMTVISSLVMFLQLLRILRNYRTLTP